MKKWSVGLIAIAVLLTTGCRATSFGSMLQTDFTLTAVIEQDKTVFQADVTRNGGEVSVCYSSPESMDGMTYTFHQDSASISYGGLADRPIDLAMAVTSHAGMIAEAIEDAIPKSGASQIEGMITNGTYEMQVNVGSGLPISLSVPEKNFTCRFQSK